MHPKRDICCFLLIIFVATLIVSTILRTASQRCNVEDEGWVPGLLGRDVPWTTDVHTSPVCETMVYIQSLCHPQPTDINPCLLRAFGIYRAPEVGIVHYGLCEVTGHVSFLSSTILGTTWQFAKAIWIYIQEIFIGITQKICVRWFVETFQIPGMIIGMLTSYTLTSLYQLRHLPNTVGSTIRPTRTKQVKRKSRFPNEIKQVKYTLNFLTYRYQMLRDSIKTSVFIKCLQPKANPGIRSRFIKEARTMDVLKGLGAPRQPNLMYLLGWFKVGQKLHMILPDMQHGDLNHAISLNPGSFQFKEQLTVFRQVLAAVEWMHKSGWAHLNIHPGSILVGNKWSGVRLGRFTDAVFTGKDIPCTEFNLHPNCSSPEVVKKIPYNPQKADVWALGTLLYFLITNLLIPYHGAKPSPDDVNNCLSDSHPNRERIIRLMSNLIFGEPIQRPKIGTLVKVFNEF